MAMPALDTPVFDADNHLYETEEALTKFLPDRYRRAIEYVEVRGRKKIVVPLPRVHYQTNRSADHVWHRRSTRAS